jgi:RES domain-containing protein
MRVWCISHRQYANNPLDGEGSRLYGGRWGSPGTRIAYASESIPLAILETFVHFDSDLIPDDLVLIAVDIPDDIGIGESLLTAFPDNWQNHPAPPELQELGDTWISEGTSVVLRVPSAICPETSNYLINPAHPDFGWITCHIERPFTFDPRLLKSQS